MPLNCSREHSWVFCWNGDFQKLFSLVFTSRHRTIKLFFWNHLLWMLNWSHYSIRLSSSLSQKCRFYSPKWNLQLSLPTTSNPTRYTHFRILLHKSRDDYLKHTRILTKLQIKSQILKSITHTPKIPQVWLWNVSELWFWIYFMISTQLYFQYRFPCFSVVATMKKCIYELCGPQARVGRMRPSTEKQATFFFFFFEMGRAFPKIWNGQQGSPRGLWECHMHHQWAQGLFGKVAPASRPPSLGSAARRGCPAVFPSL